MYFHGRTAVQTDVISLHVADIKCFPFPWDAEDWEEVVAMKGFDVRYYLKEGDRAGLWVGRTPSVYEERQTPSSKGCYQLVKLGVVPRFRRNHFTDQMLDDVFHVARNLGRTQIRASIPEYYLDPLDPHQHIADWLDKVGFVRTGEIERGALYHYANYWDIYEFKLQVP